MSAEGTRRAIVAAFIANLGIAISKFVAFVITGSASMLAESIHSVADTGNQGLLFLGRKLGGSSVELLAGDYTARNEERFERCDPTFVVARFTLGSLSRGNLHNKMVAE